MCGPTTTTTSKSSSTADGSSAGATTTTTTTNYYLGWSQVQTLLWKTVLSKVRTPIGTFFEIFSPLLLILVLVLAFQLSEISTRDAAQYTSIDLEFPGPWITLVGFVTDLIGTNSTGGGIIDLGGVFPDSTTRRQLVSKLIKEEEQQQGSGGSGGGGGPIQAAFQKFPMLQEITESYGELYGFSSIFGEKEEVEEEIHPLHTILSKQQQSRRHLQTTSDDDNTNTTDDDDDVFDFLGDASSEIRDLLTNPFPVPTFGQYIMASQALTSFLLDPDDLPIILSQSSFGRSWGNLLTLGTLHISSSSSSSTIAEEFVNYLENEFPLVLIEIMDESSSSNNSTTTAEEEAAAAAASVKVRFHESEEMAVRFINDNLDERTWALIDFTNNVEEEESMEFQIRMNYTTLPNTNQIVNYIARGLSTRYERYYLSGYLTLQRTIDEFAMSRVGGCTTTTTDNNPEEEVAFDTNILSMPMPTAAFEQNVFFTAVGYLLGLTIAMAFLYPTSRMIKMMVEEKESRMKETLFILGVRPWAHWLSWFVSSNGTFLVSAILVSWALTTSILTNSNAIYLYIFIGAFATSTVGFCFVVGACFSRAKLAAIVGPMAFFATLLPRFIFFGSNRYESTNGKVLASLLPCTAFAFGADIVADYEYAEVGIQSWNASEGEYSFNTAIGMLLFDTVLFTFLGWYLDLVIPRQFGVARPWYFLLTPRYWWSVFVGCFGSSSLGTTSSTATMEKQQQQQGQEDSSSSSSSTDNFEPILDDALTPTVFIQNLVKKYNRKANRAVDDLNLTLYESQITCLLGHNGAGKTTTISILTGLFPPTSGDCSIYGNSIVHNPNNIRQSMGICPQHNVLFDRLTVTEHLYLFQKIKGLSPTSAQLVESAVEVGLGEYHQTTSQALSGGNKRKLSLAIALCGNPQFLVLDEPTSGMDVESRRHCWELLRRRSKSVTTLLTTHFLDEASLLADRIAIMKEGTLQCCGSELFLKSRFGLGYNLTTVLDSDYYTKQKFIHNNNNNKKKNAIMGFVNDDDDDDDVYYDDDDEEQQQVASSSSRNNDTTTAAAAASINAIVSFLNETVSGTKLIRESARELTFRFPRGAESQFPQLFDRLATESSRLGIGSYGISDTTLEEIFLQLADKDDDEDDNEDDDQDKVTVSSGKVTSATVSKTKTEEKRNAVLQEVSNQNDDDDDDHLVLEHLSPVRQIALLYRKRSLIQRRDIKGFFFTVILPVILCALILLVLIIEIPIVGPPMEMSLGLYAGGARSATDRTDVTVGGGASLSLDENAAATTSPQSLLLEQELNDLSSLLSEQYPNARIAHLENVSSSDDLSQHLLDTYNDKDHNERYGSFVLFDQINFNIEVNWRSLLNEIGQALTGEEDGGWDTIIGDFLSGLLDGVVNTNETTTATGDSVVDLTDVFGTANNGTSSSLIDFNISSPFQEMNNDTFFDPLIFYETTQKVLASIIINGTTTNPSLDNDSTTTIGTETVANFRRSIQKFVNATSTTNSATTTSIFDATVIFLNDILSVAIRGAIPDIQNATVEQIAQVVISQEEIYDRSVIRSGMYDIFDVVLGPFFRLLGGGGEGGEGTNDTTTIATSKEAIVDLVVGVFDGIMSAVLGNNVTSSPNDFLLLPIVMLDEIGMELVRRNDNDDIDQSSSFGDFTNGNMSVGYYNVGGNPSGMELLNSFLEFLANSYLSVKVDDITIDLSLLSASAQGLALEIAFPDFHLKAQIENATLRLPSMALSLSGMFLELMSEPVLEGGNVVIDLGGFGSIEDLIPTVTKYTIGIDSRVSILHNSTSPHAIAAFNQAYMQTLFQRCTDGGDPVPSRRLVSINHPLPITNEQAIEVQTILSILASLFLLIPYCYIPGAFVVFLVKERVSKSKHLQLVSGVDLTSYWVSTYLWDLTLFVIITGLLMAVFFLYGSKSAVVFVGSTQSAIASAALTFGYGLSILPFSYLLSRMFNNHSSAQIAIMAIIFICGFVAVNGYFIMTTIEETEDLAETLLPLFRCFPSFNVGEGFIRLSQAYFERLILNAENDPLDWDVAGLPIFLLYMQAIPYFLLLLFLEYSADGGSGGFVGRIIRKVRTAYTNLILRCYGIRKDKDGSSLIMLVDDDINDGRQEDEDVTNERNFVKENKSELIGTASILIHNMWKVFPPTVGFFGRIISCICDVLCCRCFCKRRKPNDDDDEVDNSGLPKRAVRGVSTAVMPGETYGLLGVNGAGKTTTLGVLTGDIAPTSGEAYVAGNDITGVTPGGVAAARKNIGFCPQVDPLLDLMTGRETLRLFGRLRGIQESKLENVVSMLLDHLTLTPHAEKPSQSYSGGNKRKLSLGIALIGDPKVLFIDEASSGMDPSARRKTWRLIEQAAQTRSVIITSHSMEEVEALCTRVSIMVKGQFLCLGSVQHLKSKYLDGYIVEVHCEGGTPDEIVDGIVEKIKTETLPGATLYERHGRFLSFETSSASSISLATAFRGLQRLKEDNDIANYSISQSSLERVFIKLVRNEQVPAITMPGTAEGNELGNMREEKSLSITQGGRLPEVSKPVRDEEPVSADEYSV